MIYPDDIKIFHKDKNKHKKKVENVIKHLHEKNFRIEPKKIRYSQNELKAPDMILNSNEHATLNKKERDSRERNIRMV